MPLKTVAPEIIDGLADYDSATVQNAAAIVYGGYVSEHIDYSGPDLKPYLWDVDGSGKAVVGYAVTSTWMPLHGPSDDPNERSDLLDSIARRTRRRSSCSRISTFRLGEARSSVTRWLIR